ncbi:MAG TPA: HAMP domain-containing sensor histidine kinase, partial [Candidatus Tumulicola sp.]
MTVAPATILPDAIGRRVTSGTAVPVVVMRCTAGKGNTRGYTVRGCVRKRDVFVYDAAIDAFAVALLEEPRNGVLATELRLRSAAHRIATAFARFANEPVASALESVAEPIDLDGLRRIMDTALRRAERQRELASIAHELRSPVTSIRGYLDLLLDEPLNDAVQLRFLETARGEALRLGRLLDVISEISLLDGGALRQAATCAVGSAVDHAVDAVLPRAAARATSVRIVRRSRSSARVSFDDCVRATLNILINAIDVGARNVEVASLLVGKTVVVAVDDDGPGVDAFERGLIFQSGRRGAHSSNYAGSGYGLAVVDAIVRSRGGAIAVRSSRL